MEHTLPQSPMGEVQMVVDKSDYKGAFMITEWGPTGWWETASTEWKAPIEPVSYTHLDVYKRQGYEGFDPELASGGYTTLGVDKGIYPQSRTITVGANITF